MQFSKSILWLLPPWSAEIEFQRHREHRCLGGGRRRVPNVASLSEKVASKLLDLKEERPRGRAKQCYKAKDISLSHCYACDSSLQQEGTINLFLASSSYFWLQTSLSFLFTKNARLPSPSQEEQQQQNNNVRVCVCSKEWRWMIEIVVTF